MIALVLAMTLAQGPVFDPRFQRFNSRGEPGRSDRGFDDTGAFFSAFDIGGAGVPGGVCAGPNPTGSKGEVLTFARASTATCTKTAAGGLATSGIANGDLLTAPSGTPRMEFDSNGVLGLLVESAGTNSLVRSEEIDNAAWTKGVGLTVTANYAAAPDGATTAERLQYTTTNGDYVLQAFAASGVAATSSVYLRGTSGAGAIDFCRGGGSPQCIVCSYVSTSWSRCALSANYATSNNVFLGCDSPTKGSACSAAGDVLVWGIDAKPGAYPTSYVPTVAAAVTRASESASFTLASAVGPSGCIAASMTWGSSGVGAVNVLSLGTAGAGNNMTLYRNSNTTAGYQIGGTVTTPAVSAIGTTTHRSVLADMSGTRSAYWDAVSVTAPATSLSAGQTAVAIAAVNGGGTPIDGIISRVQIDPSFARCAQ